MSDLQVSASSIAIMEGEYISSGKIAIQTNNEGMNDLLQSRYEYAMTMWFNIAAGGVAGSV